jgi:murein DD-endopeptidase MepM/ murein hydrolase activator NlpD
MSRIDVKQGAHVEQGQHIGAVGMTGWATGPHLHFEVKINGVQQDPLIVAKSSEPVVLSPASKVEFAQLARSLKEQLEVADTMGRSGGAYAE